LAKAIQSGKCPQGLQINLSYNEMINNEGIKVLIDALATGQCPQGLQIIFEKSYSPSTQALYDRVNILLRENGIKHAALSCVALQQGLRQQHTYLNKLPQAVAADLLYPLVPSVSLSKEEEKYFRKKVLTAAVPKETWLSPSSLFRYKNKIKTTAEEEEKIAADSNSSNKKQRLI